MAKLVRKQGNYTGVAQATQATPGRGLTALEQRILQSAADLLTDKTDPREQQARQMILGVIADKEGDG